MQKIKFLIQDGLELALDGGSGAKQPMNTKLQRNRTSMSQLPVEKEVKRAVVCSNSADPVLSNTETRKALGEHHGIQAETRKKRHHLPQVHCFDGVCVTVINVQRAQVCNRWFKAIVE